MDEESTYHPDMDHPYLGSTEADVPTVKVLSGMLRGKEYRLTQDEYIIGRDPGTQIVIEEKEVSRRHAMIIKRSNEYMLCDLDSTNGVYVNNLRLEKSVLKNGDLFQIGSCIFQFIRAQKSPKV